MSAVKVEVCNDIRADAHHICVDGKQVATLRRAPSTSDLVWVLKVIFESMDVENVEVIPR